MDSTRTRGTNTPNDKIFVPFSEALVAEVGLNIGDLVPFQLNYDCLRLGAEVTRLSNAERSALGIESGALALALD